MSNENTGADVGEVQESTEKTEPCPICGKALTTKPQPRMAHIRACTAKKEAEQVVNLTGNAELDAQIAQARKVAEFRKKQAPNVSASTVEDNSAMGMKEQMVRALKKVPEDCSLCWRRVDLRAVNVSKGYEPIVVDGQTVRENELELYFIPKVIPDAAQKAAGLESKSRLGELLEAGDEGKVEKRNVA